MDPRRLAAPREDGGLLCQPAPDRLLEQARESAAWYRSLEQDWQGLSLSDLRAQARREVLEASARFHEKLGLELHARADDTAPWLMTGHQPELFHPGVWAKNIAVGVLGAGGQATAVNLIVDDDVPKSASIRVPCRIGEGLRGQGVAFQSRVPDTPFEDWRLEDREGFASFGARVSSALGDLIPDPMIRRYWPEVMARVNRTDRVGWLLAAGRHALEPSLGARSWEIPQSRVCETEAFAWFTCHILAHLERFREIHNETLEAYRLKYHIRSTHHPVPALGRRERWIEAPFWMWRVGQNRRKPVWARLIGCEVEVRLADETEPVVRLPLCPGREASGAVRAIQRLAKQGVKLRSRALTTTLFARWLLSDLFVHGIGGAKYDELGDAISRGFYGVAPALYGTLSLTLWPGLPYEADLESRRDRLRIYLRDLEYHVDVIYRESADRAVQQMIAEKRAAIAAVAGDRRARRLRWRELQRLNRELAARVADLRVEAVNELQNIEERMERQALARSRELSFVVHSEQRLERYFGDLADSVRGFGTRRSD
jgi:hypothetical protein